jgi:hypothetical protein
VRVKRPERLQVQWRDASLDQMIPKDHRVRSVWAYVDSLDLQPLFKKIQALKGMEVGPKPIQQPAQPNRKDYRPAIRSRLSPINQPALSKMPPTA